MSDNKHTMLAELFDVVFSKENGSGRSFAVVKLRITKHSNPKKIGNEFFGKGLLYPLDVGVIYKVSGVAEYNEKYSRSELRITDWLPTEDMSTKGLVNYLSNEAPGIGESTANKIAAVFGDNALDTIERSPGDLVGSIDGITWEKANVLSAWRKEDRKNSKVKQSLYSLGLSTNKVKLIMSFFKGEDVYESLKSRCFDLVELKGVGYLTCCKIADRLGIPNNDHGRIKAGIVFAFESIVNSQGSTCVPYDKLIIDACKLIKVGKAEVSERIHEILDEEGLVTHQFKPYDYFLNKDLIPKKETVDV